MPKNGDEAVSQIYAFENSIDNFAVDYFGYKKVAKELAVGIIKLDSKSGYVIAVNGKWGSGKSSFLFYTREYLTTYRKELGLSLGPEAPIIFNFNPWLFSGHQDVISQFFTQIKAQAKICQTHISQKTMNTLNKLFSYGSHLKLIPTIEGQLSGLAFTGINKVIESQMENSVKSIFEIKLEITKELKESDEKIIIIIDDIDRLTSNEIRELFRAIKAIADFPNLVFLLAYDGDIVTSALDYEFNQKQTNSQEGLKYLEKIVQFSIPLPMIGETQLKKYTEQIIFDKKFSDTTENLIEAPRWTDLYHNGLRHFLKTPRNVIRLNNALLMLYPSVKNEVNVVDFISLLVIKLNYPKLYDRIKEDHRFFIIDTSIEDIYFLREQKPDVLSKYHGELIQSIINKSDQQPIALILASIFPKISPYLQPLFSNSSVYIIRSSKPQNISHDYNTFLKYFRFQTEPEFFSNSELSKILESINNPDKFAEFILQLNGLGSRQGTKALIFFESILPRINADIPQDSLKNMVIGIFKIDKKVLSNKNISSENDFSHQNICDYIGSVLYKLLSNIPKEERVDILKKSYSVGTAYALESRLIIILRQMNGDWEGADSKIPTDFLLVPEELKKIEDIYVEKIQAAFLADLTTFASPYIGDIVYVWNKLKGTDNKTLVKVTHLLFEKDDVLMTVIHSSRENHYLDPIKPYSLEPMITEEKFRERVNDLMQTKTNDESIKTSLRDFLDTKKRILQNNRGE
jgi:KAP family P-loop domain.